MMEFLSFHREGFRAMLRGFARFADEPRTRPILAGAIVTAGLGYLSFWAGIPERGPAALALGVAALIALTLACGALAWHWTRPATARIDGAPSVSPSRLTERRLFASLLAISTLSLTVGGFWDEVWHRKYGLPFGEDLLWRPHLLIYFGLLLPVALAAVALARLLQGGRSGLTDRLRADRGLGLLVVAGAFLLLIVPADPLWHIVYGEDISAWSLPHLVLLLAASAIAILGVYLQLSTLPSRREWARLGSAKSASFLALVFFAGAASILAQVLIGDFVPGNPVAADRPVWMLPALMTGLAVFLGTMANHTGRWYGAASTVGVLTVAVRFILVQAFDFRQIEVSAWLPWMPALVVVDLWYAFQVVRRTRPAGVVATATAALVGAGACLWLIPRAYPYLQFAGPGLFLALLMCWIVSVAAAWLGRTIGDGLAAAGGPPADPTPAVRYAWIAPVALVVWLLFVVYFIATASPPIQRALGANPF
jgi:hypothetical protein